MTIPNTLAFARNINLANTTLSPTLLLHCGAELPFLAAPHPKGGVAASCK